MKVSDLKKGMMLTCAEEDCFAIYGITDSWIMVRNKPKPSTWGWPGDNTTRICQDTVMIYLGTKKDINIKMKWTDRFVLINNEIVGVDPSSWRRIKPV